MKKPLEPQEKNSVLGQGMMIADVRGPMLLRRFHQRKLEPLAFTKPILILGKEREHGIGCLYPQNSEDTDKGEA